MHAAIKRRTPFNLATALFTLALFCSSFDTFLVIDAGFTFRACQGLLLFAMLLAFVKAYHSTPAVSPPALWALSIWTAVATLSMTLHGITPRAAGYCVWLIFNVCVIYCASVLFNNARKLTALIRYYIRSFLFVACFGIFQFFSAALGLGHFLVTQWWIPGRLARVSGFSYEPSYFATYLLLGWVLCAYLLEQPRCYWPLKRLPLYFALMSFSLLISSSRLGFAAMFVWSLRSLIKLPLRSKTPVTTPTKFLALSSIAVIGVAIIVLFFQSKILAGYTFLLEGTGLGGTAAHSVNDRYDWAERTFEVFGRNPVLGVGLGGIAEEVAVTKGLDPAKREALKESEGASVAAEALAGTGIVGFTFLVLYFLLLYRLSLKTSNRLWPMAISPLIKGLLYSLTVELILLQFTQNILRPYLWLHISVLSTTVSSAARAAQPIVRASQIESPRLETVSAYAGTQI